MIAFHLLSSTAENYLSPSLATLAKIFRLSETVAGVTLLALGNGAPDVITAVVAGGDDDDGISIAIGSIFGAGLFVTTATLAVVIANGKSIKVKINFLEFLSVFNVVFKPNEFLDSVQESRIDYIYS